MHVGGGRRVGTIRIRRFTGGAARGLFVFRWLERADQAFTFGTSTNAICLGLDDARRVAFDPDPKRVAEVERLLVGEPELACELVEPDF